MKMVKSLLLGSAAGLVAVTTGQAADLPVKAKPVEYVKVCSLYGAGFYYMPGTDMCIKIGGYVRAEATWGINGSSTTSLGADFNQRSTNNLWTRERGYITADAREQTAYGTARGYIAVGIASNNTGAEANSGQFSANRAFVQWAGFTAGLSVSFYDYYNASASLYRGGSLAPSEDTGDGGWWVWGYTAQLGNGMSATIAAEERRMSQIINTDSTTGAGNVATANGPNSVGTYSGVTTSGAGYGGWQVPDIVGNIRVDQTWGGAQVMAALHQVNAEYYGNGTNATGSTGSGIVASSGHPGDRWGWVVGAGLKLNFPMIAQGDYFQGEVNYTQGAYRYLNHGSSGSTYDIMGSAGGGASQGFGIGSDCVYGGSANNAGGVPFNATRCELTTAWSFNAAYEHYWTPQWHESFVGGYLNVRYDTLANAMLCTAEGAGAVGVGAGGGAAAVAAPGCINNFNVWFVGSRLQWDVTKSFYIGVEGLYTYLHSGQMPGGGFPAVSPAILGGSCPNSAVGGGTGGCSGVQVHDQHNWQITVRMHKDFLP